MMCDGQKQHVKVVPQVWKNEVDFASLYFKCQGEAICHLSHLGVNLKSISSCFHSTVLN